MTRDPTPTSSDPSRPFAQACPHRIAVCTKCGRRSDDSPGAGELLLKRLRDAMASPPLPEGSFAAFTVVDVACMAGCARPCTVAFQAEGKASYLFGDIVPETDVAALVAFAGQYARLADGWCSASSRPPALVNKTLARLPALAPNIPASRSPEEKAR
jgi:predicted metal-binding protein